jgi:WD repeat and SOF domain-containing protein 1
VSYSDAVRFLVLYRFGGIYIDADVLLLQSMEPFAHYDFVYEWSFVKEGMNTAVMGASRSSPFAGSVIQAALAAAFRVDASTGTVTFDAGAFNSIFHPMAVLRRVPPEIAAHVEALPSIPFDPMWLTFDARGGQGNNITHIHRVQTWIDFFRDPSSFIAAPAVPTDVFKGAYTHHWHNTWSAPLVRSSLIGRAVETYAGFLEGKQPNMYNLTATPCRPWSAVQVERRRSAMRFA